MFDRPALQPGKPRLGMVYLTSREAGRPAMLFDKGDEIELTVNYDHDDDIGRRFTGRTVTYGDDPTYELFDYSLPSQVWFADPHGVICLVEPHGRSSSFAGVQEGRFRFAYALTVGDVGVSYKRINGMQSRIEGLNEWVRLSSVSHDYLTEHDGSLSSVFTLRRQEPLKIAPALNAQIRPTYSLRSSPIAGQSAFEDELLVKTSASKARPWHEHLDLHRGLRDLLVVAGWRSYGNGNITVSRTDDPERALAGNVLGERWAKVSTYTVNSPSGNDQHNRFLFDFEDVGVVGVRRWLRLRNGYRRGIAGMVHSVDMTDVALETAISEAGAALEHIGYAIAVERRETPGRHLASHLRRVAEQGACEMGTDLETWPVRFADAYNTVKHPDRSSEWSTLDLSNVLRESRLLFRCWVARRLGVSKAILERNRGLVPMSRPYEPW